ncbi:hypothetical protein [Agromyces lapidis]|uniref:Uncharacterized protein n=1 Tax=Agromyces lapidis TaxID=279574 RepID=A0ABV5SNI0_9MICO|nr:hypothetical protein [Agromyces lapidis]
MSDRAPEAQRIEGDADIGGARVHPEPIVGGKASSVPASTGGDAVGAVILLVVMGVVALVAIFYGILIAAASSCYGDCNAMLIGAGAVIGTFGPLVIAIVALVFTLMQIGQRKHAVGVPLLATFGIVFIAIFANGIASAGVG